MLETGTIPPDFVLQDQQGQDVAWSSFRGRPAVVFFYPKANTSGCTKEACEFRDLKAEFDALGAAVIGISADTVKRQSNWTAKHGLNMPLLADTERQVLEPWGVWQEKKNYGRVYWGIVRTSFLFDAEGALVQVWPKVKVKGHVDAVLARVRELCA